MFFPSRRYVRRHLGLSVMLLAGGIGIVVLEAPAGWDQTVFRTDLVKFGLAIAGGLVGSVGLALAGAWRLGRKAPLRIRDDCVYLDNGWRAIRFDRERVRGFRMDERSLEIVGEAGRTRLLVQFEDPRVVERSMDDWLTATRDT